MLLELCAEQGLQADVDYKDWQMLAPDRVEWRSTSKYATQQLEDSIVNTAKEKCKCRKELANQTTPRSNQTFPYLNHVKNV